MLKHILLAAALVMGTATLLYQYLTVSGFLGFSLYATLGGGNESMYSTCLACAKYWETHSPMPFMAIFECIGTASAIALKGIGSVLTGYYVEGLLGEKWISMLWIAFYVAMLWYERRRSRRQPSNVGDAWSRLDGRNERLKEGKGSPMLMTKPPAPAQQQASSR